MMNDELVMRLVKALEMALPEGVSVVVGGSAEPSNEELATIISGLAEKIVDNKLSTTSCCGNCFCCCEDEEEEEWDEDLCEDCQDCLDYENGDCDGYFDEDGNCPCLEEEKENLAKLREMLDKVQKMAEQAGLL